MDTEETILRQVLDHERAKEIMEFYESKAGVKGLVDTGILKIPKIFIHSSENLPKKADRNGKRLKIPVIDLEGVHDDRRKTIVREVQIASETWGFFEMVNHGIPVSLLDEMIEGVKRFHEQPTDEKKMIYASNYSTKVGFQSNEDRYGDNPLYWRDTLYFNFREKPQDAEEVPSVCREVMVEYTRRILELKDTLSSLLSEALGLSRDYLSRIECIKNGSLSGNYYPACPEPDLTLGTIKHTDPDFLTILLQDCIDGLQVHHQNQWVDVPPRQGTLVANIGDLLQLITNDKFKSVEHRVLAGHIGPRISVATFFFPRALESRFGPIKEVLSDDNPPKYRETTVTEYITIFKSNGSDAKSTLPHFKI
ncbi:hypothetical protein IFM89_038316 [Coptis chinensis]|uniref:Fe2OG dioxygenase domain-containing protein n=1 Tax=Coptis chinensis TaxID=261450 RepID=A0A835IA57_9MAGN|nr:hypothetical protein IFM89_038316 [Coptis chinensis]